jgi:hypothetical protein
MNNQNAPTAANTSSQPTNQNDSKQSNSGATVATRESLSPKPQINPKAAIS